MKINKKLVLLILLIISINLCANKLSEQKELDNMLKPYSFNNITYKVGKDVRTGFIKGYYVHNKSNKKINGLYKEYFKSGIVRIECNFIDGVQEGTQKIYYDSGKILFEKEYKNGLLDGSHKQYYESGQLTNVVNYINNSKEGVELRYNEFGILTSETNYVNDLRNGTYKYYVNSGQLFMESHYKNDMQEGIEKRYHASGKIWTEQEYVNNKQDGFYKQYSESGELEKEYTYENDKLIKSITNISRGDFHLQCTGDNVTRTCFDYYKNNLIKESNYINNKLNGSVKTYISKQLNSILKYVDDKLDGVSKYYYHSGNLKNEILFKANKITEGKVYTEDGAFLRPMTNADFNNLGHAY